MKKNSKRLFGIKAVADYLDTSERNVYRWENDLGLPLRRVADSKGRSIYADIDELELWLKRKNRKKYSKKKLFRNAYIKTAVSFVFIILIIFVVTSFLRKNIFDKKIFPIGASREGNITYIRNIKGEILWSYVSCDLKVEFPWDFHNAFYFIDIDGDRKNEIAARTHEKENDLFSITLFDHDGSILWRKGISNFQTFNNGTLKLSANFIPAVLSVAHSKNGEEFFVVLWRHAARFLSIIAKYDYKGNLKNRYLHVGHLHGFRAHDFDKDGTEEILFTGTNNLLNGEGVFGMLTLESFEGISPPFQVEPEFKDYSFRLANYVPDDPVKGNQLFYIRFKKNGFLQKYQIPHYIFAMIENIESEVIHIRLYPWYLKEEKEYFGFIYVFDNELHLVDVVPNAYLIDKYPSFLKNKEIDISLEELTNFCSKTVFLRKNEDWIPLLMKK